MGTKDGPFLRSYIRTLRGFRPKIEKLGNVLSVGAMRTMEQAKLDAAAVAATVSTEETQAIFSKGHQAAEVEEEPEQEEAEVQTVAKKTRDKPRMSKKARKQSKGGPPGVTSADADFDIKVSGDGFGESKASSKRETGEQFYLSTAVDLTDETRERGFDMEQCLDFHSVTAGNPTSSNLESKNDDQLSLLSPGTVRCTLH